jgi:hypothetical protein
MQKGSGVIKTRKKKTVSKKKEKICGRKINELLKVEVLKMKKKRKKGNKKEKRREKKERKEKNVNKK